MGVYDLVIVGSGPAGNSAAMVASRLGLRALLIDKFRHPRIKPCGGGLTPKTMALAKVLGFSLEEVIEHECREVAVVNWAGSFILHSETPLISVSRRERLDEYMFNEVLRMGVDYVRDEVVGVRQRGDGVEVLGKGGVYEARWVIGADGAPSRIARSIGIGPRSSAIALMTMARGSLSIDACILDFTRIKWGYAWVFPVSGGLYDVGLGSAVKGKYMGLLDKYTSELGLAHGRIMGHLITYRPPNTPGLGRVMLAGDALGIADPVTGEGIFHAMLSGSLAALSLRFSEPLDKYRLFISSLIEDHYSALKVAYMVYGLDSLILSRYLGLTAFKYPRVIRLIEDSIKGQVTYWQILRGMLRQVPRFITF